MNYYFSQKSLTLSQLNVDSLIKNIKMIFIYVDTHIKYNYKNHNFLNPYILFF